MFTGKKLQISSFVTLFFFTWFCFAADLSSAQSNKEDPLLKAKRLSQEGDYDGAVKILQDYIEKIKLVKKEKQNPAKAYYSLARTYYKVGEEEKTPKKQPVKKVIPKPAKKKKKKKKKKKFPVLLVIGGVVAVGIILFLVLKKKTKMYTLTVNIGEGVRGAPSSGTYTYKKGEVVNYNYSAASGYTDLNVFLDGSPVPSSGSITMNDNHTLTATSEERDYAQEVYDSIEWIKIPAGEFKMGDNLKEGYPDELPMHTVYLDAYYISKYEVTFDQYDRFCEDTGRSKPHDHNWGRGTRPVIYVSWNDARAFCDWLSAKTGNNIHLPTEAQWEKAARGTEQRRYPWGNSNPSCSILNYNHCMDKTMPVGSYPSGISSYGVHDMAGNVFEFCQDWYDANYYSNSPYKNPQGPLSGDGRVDRGGSYQHPATEARSARRDSQDPNFRTQNYIGFRLARD